MSSASLRRASPSTCEVSGLGITSGSGSMLVDLETSIASAGDSGHLGSRFGCRLQAGRVFDFLTGETDQPGRLHRFGEGLGYG